MQAKWVYYGRCYFSNSLDGAELGKFCFNSKPPAQLAAVYEGAGIIVDIYYPSRARITMRTIDVIGSLKKLLTTNTSLAQYIFRSDHNYDKSIDAKYLTLYFIR